MERSLIILKPDAVQRQLVGKIISRFEEKGFQISACKMMNIPRELAEEHYAPHREKPFFAGTVTYMTSSPVIVMILQAQGIIEMSRRMMGKTFGCDAEPGTIRGDYGCTKGFNLIHGSDSPESAEREIALFFKPEEIVAYELSDSHWLYGDN